MGSNCTSTLLWHCFMKGRLMLINFPYVHALSWSTSLIPLRTLRCSVPASTEAKLIKRRCLACEGSPCFHGMSSPLPWNILMVAAFALNGFPETTTCTSFGRIWRMILLLHAPLLAEPGALYLSVPLPAPRHSLCVHLTTLER